MDENKINGKRQYVNKRLPLSKKALQWIQANDEKLTMFKVTTICQPNLVFENKYKLKENCSLLDLLFEEGEICWHAAGFEGRRSE